MRWKATADRDEGGECPSIQEGRSRTRHIPCEGNVPSAGQYEAVTQVEVGVAFVNLWIERIQEPEVFVVVEILVRMLHRRRRSKYDYPCLARSQLADLRDTYCLVQT